MALVNEFGQPFLISHRFAHGADRNPVRVVQYPTKSCSIEELIPPFDRLSLVSLSQRLYTNKGVLRAALDQKADYSVGTAYLPEYGGADTAAGDEAESWLLNVWYPNCDVRGGVYDFQQVLMLASLGIDREGEFFGMLSETSEGGFPLIQCIPPHKIKSDPREERVKGGKFSGAKIHDGVIRNKRGRAIAYRVYPDDDDDKNFEDIGADTIKHLYNPRYQDQGRGLPTFTHALEDLKHCLQSTEDERRRQAMLSGLGLIVTNEAGGPDLNDPAVALMLNQGTKQGSAYENRQGIYYLTANAGEKLEQIKHDSPGEVYESFHDRMIREAIIGAGWAYSLVWKNTGQGTAERAEVLRARRAIASRQKLLDLFAKQVVTYAINYGIRKKLVSALNAPLSWTFTHPPRLSVDDGREEKAMNEAFRLGRTNMSDLLEADGRESKTHLKRRIDEIVERKLAIFEANKRLEGTGMRVEERELVMLTPNEQAATTQTDADPTDDQAP